MARPSVSELAVASLAVAVAACGHRGHRASEQLAPPRDPGARPQVALTGTAPGALCATRGSIADSVVDSPTFRAVATAHAGDAASLRVVVRGASGEQRELASGQERRQLGLKLRAADGCNLIYVMWRLDPEPALQVSVKRNPGQRTAKECGAGGYQRIRAEGALVPPPLLDGSPHELRAEIRGDSLLAWIDDTVAWEGSLPSSARELAGPAGLRADNLAFQVLAFASDARPPVPVDVRCGGDDASE